MQPLCDGAAQPVGGAPPFRQRGKIGLDALRRAYRLLRGLDRVAAGEGGQQHFVLRRDGLAVVRGDDVGSEGEEFVRQQDHQVVIQHLGHAREAAQLGAEERRLPAICRGGETDRGLLVH